VPRPGVARCQRQRLEAAEGAYFTARWSQAHNALISAPGPYLSVRSGDKHPDHGPAHLLGERQLYQEFERPISQLHRTDGPARRLRFEVAKGGAVLR